MVLIYFILILCSKYLNLIAKAIEEAIDFPFGVIILFEFGYIMYVLCNMHS